MRWFKIKKPPYTPEIDTRALEDAQAHVAKERRALDSRWENVHAVLQPIRERSNRNGFAEEILAQRRRRRTT